MVETVFTLVTSASALQWPFTAAQPTCLTELSPVAHLQDWESLSEDPARPGQQGVPAQQEVSCHLGGSKSFPWGGSVRRMGLLLYSCPARQWTYSFMPQNHILVGGVAWWQSTCLAHTRGPRFHPCTGKQVTKAQ